jgi:hypothetical protein
MDVQGLGGMATRQATQSKTAQQDTTPNNDVEEE